MGEAPSTAIRGGCLPSLPRLSWRPVVSFASRGLCIVSVTRATEPGRRKLIAVLYADMVGYSRLIGLDDAGTLERLRALRGALIDPAIEEHGGRIVQTGGDSLLVMFDSIDGAVRCAVKLQQQIPIADADQPAERAIRFRVSINIGDAIADGTDLHGDAVNVAARLQAECPPGGICVTRSVRDHVHGRLDLAFEGLGTLNLKNISRPVEAFLLRPNPAATTSHFVEQSPLFHDAAAGNLPSQSTSFLGREKDIADIAAMLVRARLVTLTGIGGVGKTRLSLQVAAEVSPHFQDGAWQVQLASVLDPAATGHAVAAVFGVTQQPGQTIEQSIIEALGRRRLLLVLDNCEHLIDAAAALARAIVAQCPQVTLLATSREALMIEGEQIFPVAPLGFQEGVRSPAVKLFVERARAVAPDFVMNGHSNDVSEICRRLDGIPLAIELAAARIRAMSPAQIRARLDDRFRLLTGGPRHGLERHQTLRHAVQWSFDLLTPAERIVLSRSAVFAGGFSLEAAERLCAGGEVNDAGVLDLLDGLVRKSLVAVDRSGDVVRYSLLETMRQFGEDQLAAMNESEAARNRHAQYFAEDARANFELWRSPRQIEAYRWLDREMGNLRVAFRWSVDRGDIETAGNIASNLGDIGLFQLRHEVKLWAAEIVDAARSIRHRRLPMILTWVASAEWYNERRLDTAMRYAQEALDLSEQPDFDSFIWAHADQAFIAALQGNFDLSAERAHAGAAHPVDRQDRLCTALRGYFLAMAGRHDEAMHMVAADVAAAEATRIPYSMAIAHYSKGCAFAHSDPSTAIAAYERAIAIAHESGNLFWEQLVVAEMAALQARAGNPAAALGMFRQMLDAWQGSPDAMGAWHTASAASSSCSNGSVWRHKR